MTRPQHEYETALYLVQLGLNDCQIARLLGVPRGTVRDWRRGRRTGRQQENACPICGRGQLDQRVYAYLLGLYLGDGTISLHPRAFRLRITLDNRYPGIIDECCRAIAVVADKPTALVARIPKIGCTEVACYWKHWPCVFPQHGPGRKHRRPIVLERWQQDIADRHPQWLLRGLIHSDGYRGDNWVNGKAYPRYQFSNRSADIRGIFCRACDVYGIAWRQMNSHTVSVARAADVAKLDRVIGPKQ